MKDKANRYLNSAIGRVLERIKLAKLSGKPIVYLKTDDMYVVNELMKNESFFTNITFPTKKDKPTSSSWDSSVYSIIPSFTANANGLSIELFTEYPRLFVVNCQSDEDKKNLDKSLYKFILLYTGIGIDKSKKSHIEYLRGLKFEIEKDQIKNNEAIKNQEVELEKAQRNINHSMFLIITADNPEIPANIRIYTELIKVDAVAGDELKQLISDFICELEPDAKLGEVKEGGGWQFIENEEFLNFLAQHLKGLSITKIRQILCQIKNEKGKLFGKKEELAGIIRKEKEQLIATSDCLTLEKIGSAEPAGLERLADYLRKRKDIIDKPEKLKRERGIDLAKGLIVNGVPGSGKSMMAKYAAKLLGNLPLIKMDLGDIQDKWVGSSEHRMVEALEQVNALSPCVLWIDEIEKSFSGSSGGNNSGSDVTKRLFGKFLTWMQEKDEKGISCFVFATANDISSLPPELFRSGRFDAKFYTFMPSAEECGDIFQSLVEKENKDHIKYQYQSGLAEEQCKPLFDMEVNFKQEFMKILNDSKLCLKGFKEDLKGFEEESKNDKINWENKFFTGADIQNVFKVAKEEYLFDGKEQGRKVFYDTETFIEELKKAVENTRTYGETDLVKIAECFVGLAEKHFKPSSKSDILPLKGYNKYRKDEEGKQLVYKLDAEKEHWDSLQEKYDKCIYLMVRNVLRHEGGRIVEKLERREA